METTVEEVKAFLREAGLENAGTGVFFPWGVKIVEIEGKKLLQPLTPEEYRRAVENDTGKKLPDELAPPTCGYSTSTGCFSAGCTSASGRCRLILGRTGIIYCVCDY